MLRGLVVLSLLLLPSSVLAQIEVKATKATAIVGAVDPIFDDGAIFVSDFSNVAFRQVVLITTDAKDPIVLFGSDPTKPWTKAKLLKSGSWLIDAKSPGRLGVLVVAGGETAQIHVDIGDSPQPPPIVDPVVVDGYRGLTKLAREKSKAVDAAMRIKFAANYRQVVRQIGDNQIPNAQSAFATVKALNQATCTSTVCVDMVTAFSAKLSTDYPSGTGLNLAEVAKCFSAIADGLEGK